MAVQAKTRMLAVASVCIGLFIGGCATNTATNQSNYGQRSDDVEAIDETIEHQIGRSLKQADARLGDARIRSHSFDGTVLLVGQVPSQELKDMAESVVSDLRGVDTVHNELTIAANLPATQRLADTWLTTNVISSLATNDRVDSSKLKVTTENATVYLMGIVTRAEAERIVQAASSVAGIQRIVKVFDYLD
ncbi:BON domain-containing protein [Halomonas sp. Bachu 37]|uniref:BON domain-containing protein n=1 Tax=Halomonas kashgarensis TaxID=3084920 RepID=UPI0032167CE1